MITLRIALALGLALTGATSFAQSESSCLVAGRLSDTGKWAPRMSGVQLLSQDGRAITGSDRQSLARVKQVRVTAPALLATCDGDAQLALGPDAQGAKAPVPALNPGTTLAVESVSYPKMRRGGELVELKVTAPAERVTLLTR